MDEGICVDKVKKQNNYLHNTGKQNKVTWKAVNFFEVYVSH